MDKQKQCMDIYGEPLKIGDEVIPVMDEALIIGESGIISKIEYSKNIIIITLQSQINKEKFY